MRKQGQQKVRGVGFFWVRDEKKEGLVHLRFVSRRAMIEINEEANDPDRPHFIDLGDYGPAQSSEQKFQWRYISPLHQDEYQGGVRHFENYGYCDTIQTCRRKLMEMVVLHLIS